MDLLVIAVMVFMATSMSIGILIPNARRLDLLERPAGHRTHEAPTPLVGGLAICAGLLVGFSLLPEKIASGWAYMVGAGLLIVSGYLDDRHLIGTVPKAILQISAALTLCMGGGVVIHSMGDLLGLGPIQLGWLALPFTVFCIVGLINAMNMLDGLDGLAAGNALTITGVLGVVAYSAGAGAELGYILVVAAGIAAFLCFNIRWGSRQARTFMGDTGSMLLGYTLAWLVILLSQEPVAALRPMTVLWILIVPVMDAFRLIWLRTNERVSPFSPDNRHVHHLLAGMGWPVNRIVLLTCAATLAFSATALFLQGTVLADPVLFYGFAGLFFVYLALGAYLSPQSSVVHPAVRYLVEIWKPLGRSSIK